ncbi:hypothetical protein RBB77_21015 [Tunturibacter psychrotolerans]|uniref:Secreted protein n=1 Tax=Tunturiibacter psychrotolerans TaxID=3069686 RepID=A0AAU7ZPL3_9BACT
MWCVALFFLAGDSGVFAGCFSKKACLDVVFWWRERGGMRGKRGVLAVTFSVVKNAPDLGIYFSGFQFWSETLRERRERWRVSLLLY